MIDVPIRPKRTSKVALHMCAFDPKAAQVGIERDHAPISVEQRLLIISSITASFVSGSKYGLSMSRNASRHHSCGDIPLASFIGFSGGASYRVSQPVKANPRINRISTWIIRRGYK